LLREFTIELFETRGNSDTPTGIFVAARKPPV